MVEEKLRLIAVLDPGGLKRSGRLASNDLRPVLVDKF
jgi:hypothetical protein